MKSKQVNEIIEAIKRCFGKKPAACDCALMVDMADYNHLVETVNRISVETEKNESTPFGYLIYVDGWHYTDDKSMAEHTIFIAQPNDEKLLKEALEAILRVIDDDIPLCLRELAEDIQKRLGQ